MSGAVVAVILTGRDVVPDAVNWTDISFAASLGRGDGNTQTVTGINQAMTFYWTGAAFVAAGGLLGYSLNSAPYVVPGPNAGVTAVNNDTLSWEGTLGTPGGPYTISVFYGTPGSGTLWDTFTVTAT